MFIQNLRLNKLVVIYNWTNINQEVATEFSPFTRVYPDGYKKEATRKMKSYFRTVREQKNAEQYGLCFGFYPKKGVRSITKEAVRVTCHFERKRKAEEVPSRNYKSARY